MKRMYFTYGTSDCFPYGIKNYVTSEAPTYRDAIKVYMMKYPSIRENDRIDNRTINCAFYYTEEEWTRENMQEKWYKGIVPSDEIHFHSELERVITTLEEAANRDLNSIGDIKDIALFWISSYRKAKDFISMTSKLDSKDEIKDLIAKAKMMAKKFDCCIKEITEPFNEEELEIGD